MLQDAIVCLVKVYLALESSGSRALLLDMMYTTVQKTIGPGQYVSLFLKQINLQKIDQK